MFSAFHLFANAEKKTKSLSTETIPVVITTVYRKRKERSLKTLLSIHLVVVVHIRCSYVHFLVHFTRKCCCWEHEKIYLFIWEFSWRSSMKHKNVFQVAEILFWCSNKWSIERVEGKKKKRGECLFFTSQLYQQIESSIQKV